MELTLNVLLALLQMLTINVCDSLPSRGRLFSDAVEFEQRYHQSFSGDEFRFISTSDTTNVVYSLPVCNLDWEKLKNGAKAIPDILIRDSIGCVSIIDKGRFLYRYVLMSGLLEEDVPSDLPLIKYCTGFHWPWVWGGVNDRDEYAFMNIIEPISPEGRNRNTMAEYRTLVSFMQSHMDWNFFVIRGVWGIWMQKDDRMMLMNALPCKRTRRGVRIKRHELPLELSAPLVPSRPGAAYKMYVNHISDKIPRRIKDDEANAVPSVPMEGVYVYDDIVLSIMDGQPVFDWLYDTLGYDKLEAIFFYRSDPFFVVM